MVTPDAIKKGQINAPNFANNTTQKNCIGQRYDYIPVDYIKCQIIGLNLDHFKQNMTLTQYESKKENKSKYLKYTKDNLTIKYFVDSGRITLSGSLHKYFNRGLHNYNMFSHQNYLDALKRLKNDFAITPDDLKIICLEYGVNIKPPIKTKLILDNIMMHRQRETETNINYIRGHYKQIKHDKYIIKAYDKKKQFNLIDDLLRFEIKETNWSETRLKNKIITLTDFNKADKSIFVKKIISKWYELLFYDPTIKCLSKWDKYSNINFWRNVSEKQFSKHKARLNKLSQTHGENIRIRVGNEILNSIKGVQNSDFSKKKVCKLTGIDISTQKENSFLLSHNGLKAILKTDYDKFNHLKKRYLSHKWQSSSTQTQIKEIAHNIRSRYNYLERHRPTNQLRMF